MLKIKPLKGLYPARHLVHQVASVPYDVVDCKEARELAADSPYSLLRVERAELELPDGTDPYADKVYAQAAANLAKFRDDGVLLLEEQPVFYVYSQKMGNHEQVGIAVACHIEDYENDLIKKHEKTRREKEDDRTRLIHELNANTSPVFLTYKDQPTINDLVENIMRGEPYADFVAADGVEHKVWKITDTEPLSASLAGLNEAYVADGHHRTASAVRVGKERRDKNTAHTGNEPYNWFLCVLFPDSQLQILPYNRLVTDLNGHSALEFIDAIREHFVVTPNAAPHPQAPGDIRMYLENTWYQLEWTPAPDLAPADQLDVAGLQDHLLAPLLGVEDPRTSQRIQFIGGIRGIEELEKLVNTGTGAVAFSMYPTTVEQLMAIADAGQIMPPKSTWFEPKLRSGLFIHLIE